MTDNPYLCKACGGIGERDLDDSSQFGDCVDCKGGGITLKTYWKLANHTHILVPRKLTPKIMEAAVEAFVGFDPRVDTDEDVVEAILEAILAAAEKDDDQQ